MKQKMDKKKENTFNLVIGGKLGINTNLKMDTCMEDIEK